MRLAIPFSVLLLAALPACSPVQVNYDYDARASYAQYRTFDWDSAPGDDFNDRRIRAAVEKELAAKGIRRAEGAPDLLVSAHPVYRDQQIRSTGVGVGIGLRILPGVSVGVGTGSAKAKVQTIGRIVLEFKDTRNSQMIWKAEAVDAFESGDTPEDTEASIQRAVTRMLERFPPPAQQGR